MSSPDGPSGLQSVATELAIVAAAIDGIAKIATLVCQPVQGVQTEPATARAIATTLHRMRARLDVELANLALVGVVPEISLSSSHAGGPDSAGVAPISTGAHP